MEAALVNQQGFRPLIVAAHGGHSDIASVLLRAGAEVDASCNRLFGATYGATPLILAAGGGHVGIVSMILKAGADVNLADGLKSTPLLMASKSGHIGIV